VETVRDIWEELGTRVRRFVGSRVNDEHVADDITQDVMLKVQAQLDTLPAEEKLPAWVFAVARNAIVDDYRARAVRDHSRLEDVDVTADHADAGRDTALRELTPCLTRMVRFCPSLTARR
jgi:RNA polymerase sigma-70 factor (ECF subfamily)